MLLIDDLPAPLLPMSSTLRCFWRLAEFIVGVERVDDAGAMRELIGRRGGHS